MEAAESLKESTVEAGEEESGGREDDARLSVTQSDDPRSGGHFAVGMSKPPLQIREDGEAGRCAGQDSCKEEKTRGDDARCP